MDAPQHSSPEDTQLTDSPWFWVAAFAGIGLVALFAMEGKYDRRQSQIESRFQSRERIEQLQQAEAAGRADSVSGLASDSSADLAGGDPTVEPIPFSTPDATMIGLWPIRIILLILVLVSGVILARGRRSLHVTDSSSNTRPGR